MQGSLIMPDENSHEFQLLMRTLDNIDAGVRRLEENQKTLWERVNMDSHTVSEAIQSVRERLATLENNSRGIKERRTAFFGMGALVAGAASALAAWFGHKP